MRQQMTPTERRWMKAASAFVWAVIVAVLTSVVGPALFVAVAMIAGFIGLAWLTCAAWTGEWYP